MTHVQKSLITGLLLTGLVFAGMAGLVHSTFFHQGLLRVASRVTGWQFQIERSAISLLSGRLTLEEVLIQKQGSFQLKTRRLSCALSPLSLLRGKLITQIELDQPEIVLSPPPVGSPKKVLSLEQVFEIFDHSVWLQNIMIDRLALKQAQLTLPSGKKYYGETIRLAVSPTLLKQIELKIQVEDLQEEGKTLLNSLQLAATLRRNGLDLQRLDLATGKGNLPKVQLGLKGGWEGTLEKGKTHAEGKIEVSPTLSAPITFELASTLKNRRAEISSFKAELDKATFDSKGFFDFSSRGYSLPFTIKGLDLDSIFGRLKGVLLKNSKGTAEVEGLLEGKFPALIVHSTAQIKNLRHRALATPRAAGKLDLIWPRLIYDANFFHVKGGSETQTGSSKGEVDFKHVPGREKLQALPQTIEVHFDKTPLAGLVPEARLTGKPDPGKTESANLEGTLKLQGVLTSVKGGGTLTATQGQLGSLVVESLTTDLGIMPGGKLTFSNTTARLTHLPPITWPQPLHMDTSGDNITFEGKLSREFSIRGAFLKPVNTLRIDQATYQSGVSALTVNGTITPGEKIDLKGKGDVDMAWFDLFESQVQEGSGPLKLDLRVLGNPHDPSFQGSAEFQGNSLVLRTLSQEISGLKGTLNFQGKRVHADLQGNMEEGNFHLRGETGWGQGQTTNMQLTGTQLSMARPGTFSTQFDCQLALKGNIPTPLLEGRVNILSGRYFKKFEIRNLILRPVEEGPNQSILGAWDGTRLNLAIQSPGGLEIRNNIVTATLQSDLKVDGTVARPRIGGNLTLQEGSFHYLGTDFEITEGRVEFNKTDSNKPDPTLFFVAQEDIPKEATIPTHTVSVQIAGRLSNLKISYASSPPEAKEDIISLVAFGLTRQQLQESGRSLQSLTTGLLAEEVSGVIERPLTKATGLDIFRLEASTSSNLPLSLSRLALGKNVTDRWSVEFKTDLSPETAERTFETNYYLTDNILLTGSRTRTTTDQKYHFGLSLRLHLY